MHNRSSGSLALRHLILPIASAIAGTWVAITLTGAGAPHTTAPDPPGNEQQIFTTSARAGGDLESEAAQGSLKPVKETSAHRKENATS